MQRVPSVHGVLTIGKGLQDLFLSLLPSTTHIFSLKYWLLTFIDCCRYCPKLIMLLLEAAMLVGSVIIPVLIGCKQ